LDAYIILHSLMNVPLRKRRLTDSKLRFRNLLHNQDARNEEFT